MTTTVTDPKIAAEIARLDLVAESLPLGRMQMPIWTAIVLACSSGLLPSLATAITPGVVAWAVLQGIATIAFHLGIVWFPRGKLTGKFGIARRDAYIAVYTLAGLSWGLLAWTGETAISREAIVAVILISVVAVYGQRLSAHRAVYLPTVLVLAAAALPSFMRSGTELSILFAVAGPLWFGLLIASSLKLSASISEMIETRLLNEGLVATIAGARDEAEAASRAKSNFLANMSHELRTPLNAIIGFSDIMKDGLFGALDARYRSYAEDINTSGGHLLALINDLLDIAKIEAGRMQVTPQAVDVAEEMHQIARLLQPRAREKLQTIALALDAAPHEILVDGRAFKQIALNLAGNAVKFTQAGGAVEIGLRAEGGDAVFWVSDDGPGIAGDRLERLFRPFERIDNAYSGAHGGTGLGLALVKALAGLHGGTVAIESATGQGTKVTVRFPGAVSAARPAALAA